MSQLSAPRASDLAVVYKSTDKILPLLLPKASDRRKQRKKDRLLIIIGPPEKYLVTKANKEVKTKGGKRKKHEKRKK